MLANFVTRRNGEEEKEKKKQKDEKQTSLPLMFISCE
jgi:hypothetical protein